MIRLCGPRHLRNHYSFDVFVLCHTNLSNLGFITVVAILPFCPGYPLVNKHGLLEVSMSKRRIVNTWKEHGVCCEGRWPLGSHSLQWFFYLVDEIGTAVKWLSPSIAHSWNLQQKNWSSINFEHQLTVWLRSPWFGVHHGSCAPESRVLESWESVGHHHRFVGKWVLGSHT